MLEHTYIYEHVYIKTSLWSSRNKFSEIKRKKKAIGNRYPNMPQKFKVLLHCHCNIRFLSSIKIPTILSVFSQLTDISILPWLPRCHKNDPIVVQQLCKMKVLRILLMVTGITEKYNLKPFEFMKELYLSNNYYNPYLILFTSSYFKRGRSF